MNLLLSAWKVIKSNWKLVLIISLALACLWLYRSKTAIKLDRNRISDNFEQVQQSNQVLNLTVDEYKFLNTKSKAKLDSVLKANKIKSKHVKSATIIQEAFKDTNSIEPIYSEPVIDTPKPNSPIPSKQMYSIPVSLGSKCWGIKGVIKSTDPKARLIINERIFNNTNVLVVTKPKRFLFWVIRKSEYKLKTDCGESDFTHIEFIKK